MSLMAVKQITLDTLLPDTKWGRNEKSKCFCRCISSSIQASMWQLVCTHVQVLYQRAHTHTHTHTHTQTCATPRKLTQLEPPWPKTLQPSYQWSHADILTRQVCCRSNAALSSPDFLIGYAYSVWRPHLHFAHHNHHHHPSSPKPVNHMFASSPSSDWLVPLLPSFKVLTFTHGWLPNDNEGRITWAVVSARDGNWDGEGRREGGKERRREGGKERRRTAHLLHVWVPHHWGSGGAWNSRFLEIKPKSRMGIREREEAYGFFFPSSLHNFFLFQSHVRAGQRNGDKTWGQ